MRCLFGLLVLLNVCSSGIADDGKSLVTFNVDADKFGTFDDKIDFRIYLDGEFLCYVSPNGVKTAERAIREGKHTLQIYHGPSGFGAGGKKITLSVAPNDVIEIEINIANAKWGVTAASKHPKCSVAEAIIDDEIIEKVIKKSAPFTVEKGVTKEVTESVEVTQGVEVSSVGELGTSLTAAIPILQASIKNELTRSEKSLFSKSEKKERKLTIVGDGQSMYRLVWIKRVRKGSTTFAVNGQKFERQPIEVAVDFDIQVEVVKAN